MKRVAVISKFALTDNPGLGVNGAPADTGGDGLRLQNQDEKSIRMDKPEELVMVLAEAKADAIISRMESSELDGDGNQTTLLITADTVVVYRGIVREKPSSKEEAWDFIKGKRKEGLRGTEVYFHVIQEEIIHSIIEGTALYVAGGLMLEHPLISPFVEAVIGTSDTVMGLPKNLQKSTFVKLSSN